MVNKCSEVKNSIQSGKLSLSNAATVEVFTKKTNISAKEILPRVLNKNTRETEMELDQIAKEKQIANPKTSFKSNISTRKWAGESLVQFKIDSEKLELLKSRLKVSEDQDLMLLLIEEKLKSTSVRTDIKARKNSASYQTARSKKLEHNGLGGPL